MDKKELDRYEMFFRLLARLNRQKPFGVGGIFDCGELGFCTIWWGRHGWECSWSEVINVEEFLKKGK